MGAAGWAFAMGQLSATSRLEVRAFLCSQNKGGQVVEGLLFGQVYL